MTAAIIALGANTPSRFGAPRDALNRGLRLLAASGFRVKRVSAWRRTPAYPPGSGPDFVNGAAEIVWARRRAAPTPETILEHLHDVEAALGRPRRRAGAPRWRPRVADFDLIAVGSAVRPSVAIAARWMAMDDEEAAAAAPRRLILPHPRMHRRAFVLAPMLDVAPNWRHPLLGRDVASLLADLPPAERDAVRLWQDETKD